VESDTIEHQPPSGLSRMLLKLPLVAHYRRVRGLSYVISWLHRLTGVALVGFCFFHVLTLQSLKNPAVYDAKMRIFSQPLFIALEWGLSFPVMFHVLNGGRLILYESFGYRNDETSLRWTAGLLFLFCGIQAVFMIDGSQSVFTRLPQEYRCGPFHRAGQEGQVCAGLNFEWRKIKVIE
jgi:succinate dehydrogenase cytochrome b556 subunit